MSIACRSNAWGNRYRLGDLLNYRRDLAEELHALDRVHTYGSFHIADVAVWTLTHLLSTWRNDARILLHMVAGAGRGGTHAERLESFYRGQASGYDAFRSRLLHGRAELFAKLNFPPHARWADMGAGTGENVERIGEAIHLIDKAYLVDLSLSLLAVARRRAKQHAWAGVVCVEEDITSFAPADGPLDVVTFSYSLTMTPDWFRAIDRAWQLLRPRGVIGVVDFYVGRKYPVLSTAAMVGPLAISGRCGSLATMSF